MSVFTEPELTYLGGQRLGRLATVGPDGAPHVVPVSFRHNPDTDTIDVGGHGLAGSKKWRDLASEPRVAFVVDDVLPPWRPRMVEIRGRASRLPSGGATLGPGFGDELIRIVPSRILSFGLVGGFGDINARDVEAADVGRADDDRARASAPLRDIGRMSDQPAAARDTLRVLRRVRSVRDFRPDPIPEQDLAEILEVARWTGSGGNSQPWTFVVVRDRATLQGIAVASPNTRHVGGAAAAILIVMPGESPAIETFDEARAAERILVAATALGLASAIGWIMVGAAPRVKELLGIPAERSVRTLVSLGYPTETGARPKSAPGAARRPLEEIVRYERYG